MRQPFSGKVDITSTSTVYTITSTPALSAYADGLSVTIIPNVDCGASPTLNFSGKGATPLVDADGVALKAGDMKANKPYSFVRVGSNFFIRSGGASKVILPLFTGTYRMTLITPTKGFIECQTSGNLTFDTGSTYKVPSTVDVFAVGGGGGGGWSVNGYKAGGGGGGGGYSNQILGKVYAGADIIVTIGAGGIGGAYNGSNIASTGGSITSCDTLTANGGACGGTNTTTYGTGGIGGNNGGDGAWGDNVGQRAATNGGSGNVLDFFGKRHAGGGGGGGLSGTATPSLTIRGVPGASDYTNGKGFDAQTYDDRIGLGGGGYGGGGGGARGTYLNSGSFPAGAGGSGVVIIRWGY